MTSTTKLAALGLVAALALVGCGSASNIEGKSDTTNSSDTLVIGSQDYYSNEIIAEIYAQSLEKSGKKVDRQLKIGQREVYMPELQAGTAATCCSTTNLRPRPVPRSRFTLS